MNYLNIRDDIIKPKLTDMLGKTLAENLTNNAHIKTIGTHVDRQKLQIFVDKVCTDENFLGMWGTAQAAKQKNEWLGLMR